MTDFIPGEEVATVWKFNGDYTDGQQGIIHYVYPMSCSVYFPFFKQQVALPKDRLRRLTPLEIIQKRLKNANS